MPVESSWTASFVAGREGERMDENDLWCGVRGDAGELEGWWWWWNPFAAPAGPPGAPADPRASPLRILSRSPDSPQLPSDGVLGRWSLGAGPFPLLLAGLSSLNDPELVTRRGGRFVALVGAKVPKAEPGPNDMVLCEGVETRGRGDAGMRGEVERGDSSK